MLFVDVSPYLRRKAKRRWGGKPRPDLDDFLEGPLEAAVFFCERGFDQLAPEAPGSPIKLIIVPPTGLFPTIVFYAIEVMSDDPAHRLAELLDYTADELP